MLVGMGSTALWGTLLSLTRVCYWNDKDRISPQHNRHFPQYAGTFTWSADSRNCSTNFSSERRLVVHSLREVSYWCPALLPSKLWVVLNCRECIHQLITKILHSLNSYRNVISNKVIKNLNLWIENKKQ